MAHGTYDAYWQARNLRPHLRGVRPAVLTVGGWHDAENLFGALQTHKALVSQSPGTDAAAGHGPLGPRRPGAATGRRRQVRLGFFQARIEFPFFMHHLKDAPDPGTAQGLRVRDRQPTAGCAWTHGPRPISAR